MKSPPLSKDSFCTGRVALSHAVDDAAAVEVVRRELDPHAVAEQHPDPVALHPAGGVSEHLVAVVEPDPEHPVAQGLDDLAFHLDLLFLDWYGVSFRGVRVKRLAARGRENR